MDIEVKILDQNLRAIGILDTFESFIWTDRFYTYGDFEVHMIMDDFWYNLLKPKNYLQCNLSDRLMIITKTVITTDVEEGSMLVVTGKSLEFMLTQRIAWGQKSMSGNFQNEVKTLINESIISPTDPDRKIDNFIFEPSTDAQITDLTIDAQYNGDQLSSILQSNCEDRKIGYRIVLNDNGQFVFQWVLGVDRSFDQLVNSYVVFSPKYDNLINSSYTESMDTYKNVILVGGEGEGSQRVYATVDENGQSLSYQLASFWESGRADTNGYVPSTIAITMKKSLKVIPGVKYTFNTGHSNYYMTILSWDDNGVFTGNSGQANNQSLSLIFGEHQTNLRLVISNLSWTAPSATLLSYIQNGTIKPFIGGFPSGLDRREVFANASDISSDVGNHKVLTPAEYQAVLQQRGIELLASSDLRYLTLFDGSIETNELYKYREDFHMGDIIQFENEYGHEGRVRIIELIISVDRSGFAIYPTYTTEE